MTSMWKTPERRLTIALILFLLTLYVPFAGNYGMWDPWETHYSEVARQMLMRHDYVSLWWPGSPQDRNEFWSKPVLTFWLIAMGMKVAGLEAHESPSIMGQAGPQQFDSEMAVGWTAEWAARIPFILCAIACVWAVWELTRRLAGRRAALWACIVLATSSQFFFVARQAMTDMAFVAPIAVALCFAGLALCLPEEESEAALGRRQKTLGPLRVSWPDVPIYYACLALAVLTVVPQLVLMSAQVQLTIPIGKHAMRVAGIVPMLPWVLAFLGYLLVSTFATSRKQIYLHIAFLMGGIATLAKGPAGIALPVIVVLAYVIVQGVWRKWLLPKSPLHQHPEWLLTAVGLVLICCPPLLILLKFTRKNDETHERNLLWDSARYMWRHPLQIIAGLLIFIAVAFPWYHAMLIRHGMGFWNEFIGDNYVRRAAGRHGDRGTFEYYITQIGHGMFPWVGVVVAAVITSLSRLAPTDARGRLRAFALLWFLVMYSVMSLVNTKFHHYILPGLPGLAILAGLYLDELTTNPRKRDALVLLLLGAPLLALAGRDLSLFPARLTWLFDYDYVNAPNGGRPWPTTSDYDYTSRVGWFALFATAATVLLALITWWRARSKQVSSEESADSHIDVPASLLPVLAIIPIATVIIAEVWQPKFTDGPHPLANGWILVGAAGGAFLLILVGAGLLKDTLRGTTIGLALAGVFACVWTGWALDRHLTDLSPHWSQKHVIASYYLNRKSNEEPLIAWMMYWRGETFYSENAIYDHRAKQDEKTVFLQDRANEKLQTYLKTHPGRRVFFIVERSRFETLRGLLPEAARPTLKAIDDTNNKVFLAVAQI